MLEIFNFSTSPLMLAAVILVATFALFLSGKLRSDVVSMITLILLLLFGVLPFEKIVGSFVHPAVILVGSMLVISEAIARSGIIEYLTRKITGITESPIRELAVLTVFVAIISGFINSVAALGFAIPIALKISRRSNVSPSLFLMPLAFASHLGGFLTLVGSSRNVIVSTFREQATGVPFGFFDFSLVGIGVVTVCLGFLLLVGWRLIPKRKKPMETTDVLFNTDVSISRKTLLRFQSIEDLREKINKRATIEAVLRSRGAEVERFVNPPGNFVFKEDDILILSGDLENLAEVVETTDVTLSHKRSKLKSFNPGDDEEARELLISQQSSLIGKSWSDLPKSDVYGVNFLAIAREGEIITKSLDQVTFQFGDIMILRGRSHDITKFISDHQLLPLEENPADLIIGREPYMLGTILMFLAGVVASSLGLLPPYIVFFVVALMMAIFHFLPLPELYRSINWSVLVVIGAMLALGSALVEAGLVDWVSDQILSVDYLTNPAWVLAIVLVISMIMSDVIHATVSAALISPMAIALAASLGVSPDPFLMAVAFGASTAFLTPIGHESNTMVLTPGGYKFKDFWKVGLPLEILVAVTSIPLILTFWPL